MFSHCTNPRLCQPWAEISKRLRRSAKTTGAWLRLDYRRLTTLRRGVLCEYATRSECQLAQPDDHRRRPPATPLQGVARGCGDTAAHFALARPFDLSFRALV